MPTDGWGDWTDPRVHVGYAARLVDALAHSGSTDLASITRSRRAVARVEALVSRLGMTH
jgi:hypothetical protein